MKKVIPAIAVMAGVLTMAVPANAAILFDYADIMISFDHTTGTLSVTDHASTGLKATLRNAADVAIDRADINTGSASFSVMFDATVVNPAGADNIGLTGMLTGSDTDAGNAYKGALSNLGNPIGDLDGIVFTNGILSITTRLAGIGGSILIDPAVGDWIFKGTSDAPTGNGADGTANQFTVAAADRASYSIGKVVVIDIAVPTFGNGLSTSGFTNADDFFAFAALSTVDGGGNGFSTTGGDMKVTIIPAPGAALLAVMGMGMVGWIKRRF